MDLIQLNIDQILQSQDIECRSHLAPLSVQWEIVPYITDDGVNSTLPNLRLLKKANFIISYPVHVSSRSPIRDLENNIIGLREKSVTIYHFLH